METNNFLLVKNKKIPQVPSSGQTTYEDPVTEYPVSSYQRGGTKITVGSEMAGEGVNSYLQNIIVFILFVAERRIYINFWVVIYRPIVPL